MFKGLRKSGSCKSLTTNFDEKQELLINVSAAVSKILDATAHLDTSTDQELFEALRPMMDHLRSHRFDMLREIASIWVAQTTPLYAVPTQSPPLLTSLLPQLPKSAGHRKVFPRMRQMFEAM